MGEENRDSAPHPTVVVVREVIQMIGAPGVITLAWMGLCVVFFFRADTAPMQAALPYVFGLGGVLIAVSFLAMFFRYIDQRQMARRLAALESRVGAFLPEQLHPGYTHVQPGKKPPVTFESGE